MGFKYNGLQETESENKIINNEQRRNMKKNFIEYDIAPDSLDKSVITVCPVAIFEFIGTRADFLDQRCILSSTIFEAKHMFFKEN